MHVKYTQNPGIGGLDNLTPSEETFVMNLAGLEYQQNDIIYYNGTALTVSRKGISFETISTNLQAHDATLNYNGNGDITSIVYSNGITKTFNYTGSDITSIVLSGATPSGISLTKTLTYTSGDVTSIEYT